MLGRLALMALLVVSGLGCGPRDRSMDLKDAVRDYNRSLRWNAFQRASRYVEQSKRGAWLAGRNSSAGGLHITDIHTVRLQKPDFTQKTVEVLVSVSWYRLPDSTIRTAVWSQTWQEIDARWRIIEEKQVEVTGETEAPQWP